MESSDSEDEVCGMTRPSLIKDLQAILQEYPDNGQIFKELLQNADDAGASHVRIIYDPVGPDKNDSKCPHFQGPAIYVCNDAKFTSEDWKGIIMLRKSIKEKDPMKVGRYGLGFKAVFHITDYPCILSGKRLLLLDPSKPEDEVCTFCPISRKRRKFDYIMDIFGDFVEMSGVHQCESFDGTVFRFPLRQVPSDLSSVIYTENTVHQLLKCFTMEMVTVLVFLKSLRKVEILNFAKTQTSSPQLTFSVCLSEESAKERRNQREILSSALKSNLTADWTNTVEFEVRNHSIGEHFHLKWMVRSLYLGHNEMSSAMKQLSAAPDLSYCPFVGVSMVDVPSETKATMERMGLMAKALQGHVFCFLPLPLQNHSLTGLPVHVNGFFALSSNRHHLKWLTADEEQHGWQRKTDTSCLWNRCLLTEAVPKAYLLLLDDLMTTCQTHGNQEEFVAKVYNAYPSADSVTGIWDCVVEQFYKSLFRKPCFFTAVNGGKWVTLADAVFCVSSTDVPTQVLDVLIHLGINVCCVPCHVQEYVLQFSQKEGMTLKMLTSSFVRDVLKKTKVPQQEATNSKLILLNYIMKDLEADFSTLHGINLLPLEDGNFVTFVKMDSNQVIFSTTEKFNMALFPGLGSSFLVESSGFINLNEKLKSLCLSGSTQVRFLQESDIPGLVKVAADYIKTKSNGEIMDWIKKLWGMLYSFFPMDLSAFEGILVLPILNPKEIELEPLHSPTRKVLKTWKETTLNQHVEAAIKYLGVQVVENLPSEVLRHPCVMEEFVHKPTSGPVLKALTAAQKNSVGTASLRFSEKERNAFVCFISECSRPFTAEEQNLLKHLPLFQGSGPKGKIATVCIEQCKTSSPPERISVSFPRLLIVYGTPEEQKLGQKLGVHQINQFDLIQECLELMLKDTTLDLYSSSEVSLFMKDLLTNHNIYGESVWEMVRHIAFIPDSTRKGILHKPSDLFNPLVQDFTDLFMFENVFPGEEFADHIPFLQKLGLRKDVTEQDIVSSAVSIEELQAAEEKALLERKSSALISCLSIKATLSHATIQRLQEIKFMPVKKLQPNYFPQKFPWFEAKNAFYAPSEVSDDRLETLIGSVLPIAKLPLQLNETQKSRLVSWFKLHSPPPLSELLKQFQITVSQFDVQYTEFYLGVVKRIYRELKKHRISDIETEMKTQHVDAKWIWNGKEFCCPQEIYVFGQKGDLRLEPYMTCLPSDMQDLKDFFLSFGCYRCQDQQLMLNVLRLIRDELSSERIVTKTDSSSGLQVVLTILRWLACNQDDSCPLDYDKVLVPVQSDDAEMRLNLMPAKTCAYLDTSQWITVEELAEEQEFIHLVHKDVPRDLAVSLGVTPLMDKLLDAQELDLNYGQKEPLTRRLKNLVQHYTDGVAVVKEIVQNADDAGADRVYFLYDERENENYRSHLLNPGMAECQGPALWAYNNAEFTDSDFESITQISGGTKLEDASKIGRFGLGFNAVYNITDVPCFVSRNFFVVFDPHTTFLGKPGLKVNISRKKQMFHRLAQQFHPFTGVFDCNLPTPYNGTLFRLPLRTKRQAAHSHISNLCYSHDEMVRLLQMSHDCLGNLLLFTQNVREVKFFHLDSSAKSGSEPALLFEVSKSYSSACSRTQVLLHTSKDNLVKIGIDLECTEDVDLTWLKAMSGGGGMANEFMISNPDLKGVRPEGSVAIPMKARDDKSYEVIDFLSCPTGFLKHSLIYCFLPLPIPTRLPVVINGSFSVSADRRHLSSISVDEKQNQGSRWNDILLQDSIACAYIDIIVSLREIMHTRIFELWPSANNCDASMNSLLVGFYRTVGICSPEIFPGKNEWTSLQSSTFLESINCRDTWNAAFDVFHRLMQSSNKVAVKLPEDIRCELLKYEAQGLVDQNTVSFQEFFVQLFLPKIQEVEQESRDALIIYALNSGNSKLLTAMETVRCIPVDGSGITLKKPSELIHPFGRIACLYDKSEGRFPNYHEPLILDTLVDLGMQKDILSSSRTLDRTRSIATLTGVEPHRAILRFHKLINVLTKIDETNNWKLHADDRNQIGTVCFLPVLCRPEGWPSDLVWAADGKPGFSCPVKVFHWKLRDLLGSQQLILSSARELGYSSHSVLKKLGVVVNPDPSDIVCHVKALSQLNISKVHHSDTLQQMYESFYNFLENRRRKSSEVEMWMQELIDIKCLYIEGCHIHPHKVSFDLKHDCAPFLLKLKEDYQRKYGKAMEVLGIRTEFSSEDILQSLQELYCKFDTKKLDDVSLNLLNRMTAALVEAMKRESRSFTPEEKYNIMLPDQQGDLFCTRLLCFDDCPWIPEIGGSLRFVHDSISRETAELLGVDTKQNWCHSEHSDGIQIPFGQKEELTTRLNGILAGYPCDSTVLKELLQNADDSGATEIQFINDMKTYNSEKVFSEKWKELQGPALCVYNNAGFTDEDLQGIQALGKGSKREDLLKTGKYGIGFNVVYHITDVPSFLTKSPEDEKLCIFDPNQQYIPNMSLSMSGMQYRKLDICRSRFPDVFDCYSEELLNQHPSGTLFRLPLRNETMAEKSKINSDPMTSDTLNELLEQFKEEAKEVLLFTKNVNTIKVKNVLEDGTVVTEYEIWAKPVDDSSFRKAEFDCMLRLLTEELQNNIRLENFTRTEVQYIMDIKDSKWSQRWLIKQRIGFEDPSQIPDVIKDAYNKRQIMHLPTAAVGFPLKFSQFTRCKAFCSLPLPIETGLPVAVDADFALDYEQRRNLFHSYHNDLNTRWNETIVQQLLAPLYASGITYLTKELFEPNESNLTVTQNIRLYHAFFPHQKEAKGHYWTLLTTAFYKYLAKTSSPVLPVTHTDLTQKHRNRTYVKRWLPPAGELGAQAFFNTLPVQYNSKIQSTYGYGIMPMQETERAASRASQMKSLLLDLDFNIVDGPVKIMQSFRAAEVEVKDVQPEEVVKFLLTHTKVSPCCNIGNLPNTLDKTNIKNKENYYLLLSYLNNLKDLKDSLEGLPLLLTCDGVLRVFSQSEKVFLSRHHGIVPKSANLFLDYSASSVIKIQDNANSEILQIKEFQISDFCQLLPLELDESVYGRNQPVLWNNEKPVNSFWLRKVWHYLTEKTVHQPDEGKQAEPQSKGSILSSLDRIKHWALIPVTSRRYDPNMTFGYSCVQYLVPVSFAEQVFLPCFFSAEGLRKLGLYFFKAWEGEIPRPLTGMLTAWHTCNLPEDILVSWSEVGEVLQGITAALSSPLKETILERFQPKLCRNILKYFSEHMEKLRLIPDYQSLIKQLPFFVTAYGKGVSIGQTRTFVLPSTIPAEGLASWSEKESLVLLQEDKDLNDLYEDLGLNCCSEIDFYCKYIFKSFHLLDERERIVHLEFVRDNILKSEQKGKDVENMFTTALHELSFIPVGKTLQKASFFYDHNNTVFQLMLDSSKFVPEPFCKKNWRDLLLKAGLTTAVSADLFMELAKQLELEGCQASCTRKLLKKSEVLVKNLFKEQLKNNMDLETIQKVKFLIPFDLNKDLELFAARYEPTTSLICFKDSALPEHQELVWSSCNVLSEYCIPDGKKRDENLRLLHVEIKPSPQAVVHNMMNIVENLNKNSLLKKCEIEPKSERLFQIFCEMYKVLEKEGLCDKLKEILSNSHCIMIHEHKCFARPNQVVIDLKAEKEIEPYLFALPMSLGPYCYLWESIGVSKTVSMKHYARVLAQIKKKCGKRELEPNETKAALCAVKGFYKALRKSEVKVDVEDLYLPATVGSANFLRISSETVICDNILLQERVSNEVNFALLADLSEQGVDKMDFWKMLLKEKRPKLLSEMIEQKLTDECRSQCQQSDICLKIQQAVSAPEVLSGIIRLCKDESYEDNSVDTQQCIENMKRILPSLKIFCCSGISTCLVYQGKVIQGTEDKSRSFHMEYVQRENTSENHIIMANASLSNLADSFQEICIGISHVFIKLPARVMAYLSKVFYLSYEGMSVSDYLDSRQIKEFLTDDEFQRKPQLPIPGSYIPVRLHCLLDPGFTFFEPGQYVGYQIDDPLEAGKEGDAIYVYAIIKEACEQASEVIWQKEYKIEIGDKEIIKVPATDLYAFNRKAPQLMDVELYTGSAESIDRNDKHEEKPMKEVKKEIFNNLKEAWQMDEARRKKVLKRLLLKWHPDKNAGREEFCTKITQYIFMLVKRFEKGDFSFFSDDDEDVDVGSHASRSSYFYGGSTYGEFFARASTRGKTYQNSYNEFSRDSTDASAYRGHGTSYSNARGYHGASYSSARQYPNPQPSEGKRWFRQAVADFNSIGNNRTDLASWVCFKCQQTAEKALKAVLYAMNADHTAIRSHDLDVIAHPLDNPHLLQLARELESILGDKGYLRTRYPDMVNGQHIPSEVYSWDQANKSKSVCQTILEVTKLMFFH